LKQITTTSSIRLILQNRRRSQEIFSLNDAEMTFYSKMLSRR
jgi:hypothetical protein